MRTHLSVAGSLLAWCSLAGFSGGAVQCLPPAECLAEDVSCGPALVALRPPTKETPADASAADASGPDASGPDGCPTATRALVVHSSATTSTSIYDMAANSFAPGPALPANPGPGGHAIRLGKFGPHGCRILVVLGGGNQTQILDPDTMSFIAGPTLTASVNTHSFSIPILNGSNAGKILVLHGLATTTSVIDLGDLTAVAGPTSVFINSGAHHVHISEGPAAGRFLVWHGNGMSTAYFDPDSQSFIASPSDNIGGVGTLLGALSFTVSGGSRNGMIYNARGSNQTGTSVFRPLTADFDPLPGSSFSTCAAGAGSSTFRPLSGPFGGHQIVLCGGSPNTRAYSSSSDSFVAGPVLGTNTQSGDSSFILSSGPQQGNVMILNGLLAPNTLLFDQATGAFLAGPPTIANTGAGGFSATF